MKKILLATLVGMAWANSSFAQSSVTVYGLLDVSLGVSERGAGTIAPGSRAAGVRASTRLTEIQSNVGPGSRLGFRGSEDLGGGLKANFVLESGLSVDTGALTQGGLTFGRQVYVGLSNADGWWISAGRQYSPLHGAYAQTTPMGGSYWGNVMGNSAYGPQNAMGATAGGGSYQTPGRMDNSLLVRKRWGDITGSLMFATGNENSRGTGRMINPAISYASGPLVLHATYARWRANAESIKADAKPAHLSMMVLGGSYDFGPVRLYAGHYGFRNPQDRATQSPAAQNSPFAYQWHKTTTNWLAARVPLGKSTVTVELSRNKFHNRDMDDGNSTVVGLLYEYALSKRTTLYASAGQTDNNAFANNYLSGTSFILQPNGYGATHRGVSLGMVHRF